MVSTEETTQLDLPSLSVVVPAFNEQDDIEDCLEALYAQRDDIAEVIVVDNNSTDLTAEKVKGIATKWPAIRIISESQPGLVSARNAGLNAATSDIIARIDADTIVLPGWAKGYRRFFANTDSKRIGASSGHAFPHDLPLPRFSEFIYTVFIMRVNWLVSHSDALFGSNMAIRRVAWHEIKATTCRKESLMEDMDIGLHLSQKGYSTETAKNARVSFSARRLVTNPWNYFNYARMWPMTYWHHGKKPTAALTWPFMLVGCALQVAAWPFIRGYDPASRRFSIRRLFSARTTRVIPKGT